MSTLYTEYRPTYGLIHKGVPQRRGTSKTGDENTNGFRGRSTLPEGKDRADSVDSKYTLT
jgi:hypothetical protein